MTYSTKTTLCRLGLVPAALALIMGTTACSSSNDIDDGSTQPGTTPGATSQSSPKGHWLLAARTPDGTEYMLQAENIEGKTISLGDKGYNGLEMPSVHYTWLFRKNVAIGMSYQQSEPGVGYGFALQDAGTLKELGQFSITNRFTNYEFYDDNTFITSVGGQVSADGQRNDGATFEFWDVKNEGIKRHHVKTIWTEDITGTDEQITFSSIVGMGDGTFLTAMVRSSFRERGADTGGSSVGEVKYPDSCWVVRMDTALNIKAIYRSDKLSYAAGQYRAQMFREVLKADDGTVYVFSNAFNAKTTRHAGALRIVGNANEFDPTYYWDIQTAAGGYKFRRVWHMTDDKFLLELYNDYNVEILGVGHQFALIDMSDRKLSWLQGLPAKGDIISGSESGGVPCFHEGYIYLPITKRGEDASIYKVDLATASATKVTTIKGAEEIRSIGYLK